MTDPDWGAFLGAAEISSIKLGAIFGVTPDLRGDAEPLPEEWSFDIKHAFKVEGDHMFVRVMVESAGPGGELSVDGVGTFEFSTPLNEANYDLQQRFYMETGVPAVIPTVRAAFNDLAMRMGMDCPPLGLVKYSTTN
jgi:hypothetical protein